MLRQSYFPGHDHLSCTLCHGQLHALRDRGIALVQGCLLARPGLEVLPRMSGAGQVALDKSHQDVA